VSLVVKLAVYCALRGSVASRAGEPGGLGRATLLIG